MTPLDKPIKRSLSIKGVDYVVTLTPEALKLTRKGHRLGVDLKWSDLTSGESALAVALQASVGKFDPPNEKSQDKPASDRSAPPKSALPAPKWRSSKGVRKSIK